MRRLAALLVLAVLIAIPAAAQPAGKAFGFHTPTAKLECKPGTLFDEPIAALRRMPRIQEAPADLRGFCAFIGVAGDGPWRRYALVQMEESPYWCGSAGCQLLIFLEDRNGRWVDGLDPNMTNNAFALEEGVQIDVSSARQGLPGLAVPQRRNPEIGFYSWVFDEQRGVYIDPFPSE